MMPLSLEVYLQIISILIGLVAVLIATLIAVVGFVYIRRFTERLDNLSNEIDKLWDAQAERSNSPEQ